MPLNEEIITVAVLREKSPDRYELVARWFLGEGDRLPKPDDEFRVRVSLTNSNRFLQADGTFGAAGDDHYIAVKPKPEVMLDPPRKAEDIPGGFRCKDQWYAATTPTKPVNCASTLLPTFKISAGTLACLKEEGVPATVIEMLKSVTNSYPTPEAFTVAVKAAIGDENAALYIEPILRHSTVPTDEGFGVCHLLAEVQRSRVQWRVARRLLPHVDETLRRHRLMGRSRRFIDKAGRDSAEAVAANLASYLVRGGPRPAYLPNYLLSAYRELKGETERHDPSKSPEPRSARDIFSFGSDRLGERWEYASIIIDALKDAALREQLDRTIDEPQKVRQHLRLRGTQGGRLLDYWCLPTASAPCTGEETRGRQYPASELMGLGLTIGNFSRADVQGWIDESDKAGARLKIAVSWVARTVPEAPAMRGPGSDTPADFFDVDRGDGPLIEKPYYVDDVALSKMLNDPANHGSTAPPQPPAAALVNYDLIQTNAGITDKEAEKIGRQIGYKTGDGRVELLIKAAPAGEPGKERTRAVGFNIYGMWEETSTQSFFDDPVKQPKPEELRPWMITRRYSYERDLKGAFTGKVIDNILAKPPWQALLEITSEDRWVDEIEQARLVAFGRDADDKAADLPNKTNPGYTVFSLDIRAGMDSGLSGGTRKFVGWDTRGAVKSSWDIEKKRDDSPAGSRPQRYRFWVTTVDCFEQESDPLPVRANDEAAGQTKVDYLFTPQRRAALLAPADRDVPELTGGRGLHYDEKNRKLIVYWETPFLNDTGKFNLVVETKGIIENHEPLKRANKDDLFSTVVIYRRPLRHKIEQARAASRVSGFSLDRDGKAVMSGKNILALPQWLDEIERLENDPSGAWTRFAEKLDVLPGATDVWTADFQLTHADRGFDYVAVLSVAVRPEKMSFWAPNVVVSTGTQGRRVQLVTRKDEQSDYGLELDHISETPGVSDAVRTKAHAVPNPERPRGVQLDATLDFHPAKPIPSPPGIARDMVLLKLLKHPFNEGTSPAATVPWPSPWPEPDKASVLQLTQGQAETINAALERTAMRIRALAKGRGMDDPSLMAAKWILASDFAGTASPFSAGSTYRQHQTVGFRGLQELFFTYKPLKPFPPAPDESEAVRFRIYAVRVPLDPGAAGNFATVRIDNCEQVGQHSYKLRVPAEPAGGDDPYKAMRPIELNQQPTMARITPLKGGKLDEDNAVYCVIAGVKRVGDYLEAQFGFPPGDMPDLPPQANISLFMAQPIYSLQSKQFDAGAPQPTGPEHYDLLLPVGGGHPEVFCWWVVSVSAQEVETDHDPARRPFVMLKLDYGTIEPQPPRMIRLTTPFDRVEHSLDPVKYKDWLPEQAHNPAAALDAPRLIVSWEPYDKSSRVLIAVERHQVKAAQQEDGLRLTADDLKPWLAILAIEAAKEDEPLQVEWLKNIRHNWLMGETVKVEPNPAETDEFEHIGVDHEPRLSGHEGLKLIQIDPSSTGRRPAFIDYFRFPFPKDRVLRMDANWLYQYRLVAYIDLGASIPDEWRYLKSRPSEWTEQRLPETMPIKVVPDKPTRVAARLGPEVEFQLMTAAGSLANFAAEAAQEDWRYRILIRRKRNFSVRTAPNVSTDFGWEDVGAPVSMWPVPGQSQSVVDSNVERADIDREAKFTYQITVNEFVRPDDGGQGDEVLIRSQGEPTEVTVTILKPANPDVEEVRMIVPVKIG